jgi:hypothetical protein
MMKSKILVMALVMFFAANFVNAGTMNGKDNGNNNWGDAPVPYNVTAGVAEEEETEFVNVCWDSAVGSDKWSVVLSTTYTYTITGDCAYACTSGEVEIEIDFGTSDVYDWLEFDDVNLCLKIEKSAVEAAFEEEFENYLGADCYDNCLDTYDFGTVYAKVKGLAPEKGKRQNNEFSSPLVAVDPWELAD